MEHVNLNPSIEQLSIENELLRSENAELKLTLSSFQNIRRDEQSFRQLFDNLTDQVAHIMNLDPLGVRYVSPSFEKIWKMPVTAVLENPKVFIDRIHPEDQQKVIEYMKLQDLGIESSVEYRLLFEDGSIRWIKDRSSPVRDPSGKVYRATGIAEDITESKLAVEKLRISEMNFRSIAEAMPQLVWSALPDGYHDYYNSQWYNFTGVPVGSTYGEGWKQMFHPDDQERASKVWKKSLSSGEPYEVEYRLRAADGSYRWILGRALPLKDGNGEIVRWMGTCTDIQYLRNSEEALTVLVESLRREQDLREHFVAALTHDLRTPLMASMMSAELLAKKNSSDANTQRFTSKIVKNLERADVMIRDLLDVSLIKVGERLPLKLEACDLGEIVEGTLEELQTALGDRFEFIASKKITGHWNPSGLRRIIENLCSNAVKYGASDTSVQVSIDQEYEFMHLAVRNRGEPIAVQDQDKLFEMFSRSESAQSSGLGGWGLGLALVKGIAVAHGGEVNVQSSAENGTVFSVKLPLDCRSSALENLRDMAE